MCKASAALYMALGAFAAPGPALGGPAIPRPGLHPVLARCGDFLLPQRRPGLEVIHDEFTGCQGVAAMAAGGADQDDGLAGLQPTDAMDDPDPHQGPEPPGTAQNGLQGPLAHPGLMLPPPGQDQTGASGLASPLAD